MNRNAYMTHARGIYQEWKILGCFISAICTDRTNKTSSTVSGFSEQRLSFTRRQAALNCLSTPANLGRIEYNRRANFARYGNFS